MGVFPCNARPITLFGFNCTAVPAINVLSSTRGTFGQVVTGATSSCLANSTRCVFDNVYLTVASTLFTEKLAADPSAKLTDVRSFPLPSEGGSFLSVGISTTVDLRGREETIYIASGVQMRAHDPSSGPVSFSFELNQFSWDLREQVVSEYVVYDIFDLFASIAAVASLTTGLFLFLFPVTPSIPQHFRFGTHHTARNIGDLAHSASVAPRASLAQSPETKLTSLRRRPGTASTSAFSGSSGSISNNSPV
ncbi:uncharacterized protein AMSG_01125 [Thecamonas trahens ATCC 50062]|uniref:Transmembrane protein n=1 Tax=Thecamonas trahens ATCC 50062 TaxID=461836 RepID=A0A0L0DLM2_THETB|nr:hypothetical protein AMSG_01125 [Thecamonas trahens ATCC 50062]KNC52298.1 hypothetical protein AMSG_01125 [Thecamonas trahens ATCC 50062]|eukprot:XP_013762297.1 hypothetical protein AMSG_01125 [Thecamonas trahens ATCC 50062]